jgi:hypothetical protein
MGSYLTKPKTAKFSANHEGMGLKVSDGDRSFVVVSAYGGSVLCQCMLSSVHENESVTVVETRDSDFPRHQDAIENHTWSH